VDISYSLFKFRAEVFVVDTKGLNVKLKLRECRVHEAKV
jgi:hypothetical protein